MNRLTEAWFEFAGQRDSAKGLRLLALPARPLPRKRGQRASVPGRSGSVWIPERQGAVTYDPIDIALECESAEGYSPDAVAAWLEGSGWLRFSDEPSRAYKARCADGFARQSRFQGFDRQRMTIVFTAQPYRYLYPEAAAVEIAVSGGAAQNPGSAFSQPRVTVSGSGDCAVTVNGTLMECAGVVGGLIIDSEAMDCYEADGVTLANAKVSMLEFPTLAPGPNAVAWTGGATKVTIAARARYI